MYYTTIIFSDIYIKLSLTLFISIFNTSLYTLVYYRFNYNIVYFYIIHKQNNIYIN